MALEDDELSLRNVKMIEQISENHELLVAVFDDFSCYGCLYDKSKNNTLVSFVGLTHLNPRY